MRSPRLSRLHLLIAAIALMALAATQLSGTARANPARDLDPSLGRGFGARGYLLGGAELPATMDVTDAVPAPDGGAYVAGIYGGDFGLIRLDAAGQPHPAFNGGRPLKVDLGGPNDRPFALSLQPDGKIVLVGRTRIFDGTLNIGVVRATPEGQPDASFDGDGSKVFFIGEHDGEDMATDVLVTPERIVVAAVSNGPRCATPPCRAGRVPVLVGLSFDGALDTSFGARGLYTQLLSGDTEWAHVVRQSGGRLVLGARYTSNDVPAFQFIGATPAGRTDLAFGNRGRVELSGPQAHMATLSVLPDDRLVVTERNAVRWYGPEGRPLTSAGSDGVTSLDPLFFSARTVALPDGSLLVAGVYGPQRTLMFAAVDERGTLKTLAPGGGEQLADALGGLKLAADSHPHDAVRSLELAVDGRLLASGRAPGQSYVARLYPDATPDIGGRRAEPSPAPDYAGYLAVLPLPDGRAAALGAEGDALLLRLLLPDGAPDPSAAEARVQSDHGLLALSADNHLLLASEAAGQGHAIELRRYDLFGRPAPLAAGQPTVVASAPEHLPLRGLLVQRDGRIVIVGTLRAGDAEQIFAARLLADGAPDPSFSGDSQASFGLPGTALRAAAAVEDRVGHLLIAAQSSRLDQPAESATLLLRLTAAGQPDPTFDENGWAELDFAPGPDLPAALALDAQGRPLLAGSAEIEGRWRMAVARLSSAGALNTSFGEAGVAAATFESPAYARAIAAEGEAVILAGFVDAAGRHRPALAAFDTQGRPDEGFARYGRAVFSLGGGDGALSAIGRDLSDGELWLAGYTELAAADSAPALARWLRPSAPSRHLQPQPDRYSAQAGAALQVSAAAGLLANDRPAGPALRAQLIAGPRHGRLTLAADGSLSYTPAAGYTGEDSFTYIVSDGLARSAESTVRITITAGGGPVGPPPSPSPQPAPGAQRIYLPALSR